MSFPDRKLLQEMADADNQQQNQRIFRIYHGYRVVLSLVFWLSFKFRSSNSMLGTVDQSLFIDICSAYTAANILMLLLTPLQERARVRTRILSSLGIIIADLVTLAVLNYSSGGVASGLAHLMLVPVATGSIVLNTRLGIFLAAVGSIAAMYGEGYLYFAQPTVEHHYVQAGLLGMLLFLLSLGLRYLGFRIRQKELVNRQQAASIRSLLELNQQIIQHMQTGVVVVDRSGKVFNCNDAARRLLHSDDAVPASLTVLPTTLTQRLEQWLAMPTLRNEPFRPVPGAPELLASFTFLQSQHEPGILIFLEDYTQLSSRAQHLKLMSLGRLAASIAHEIRNPLGAISHACQLLRESSDLQPADQRLLAIINTHSQRVNDIIGSVLEHSRQRPQVPEELHLQPWLEQFVTQFRNSYSKPVECEVQLDKSASSLTFNPGQLEQLLTNLCDNAIRHSNTAAGRPWVRISTGTLPLSGATIMDICDLGPGVPAERLDQIFEPFFTTDNRGTGLGLFICREICEACETRLFHTRSSDGLSCFRIQFPQTRHLAG